MIVMKFGGTSVDGADRLRNVARIVASSAAAAPVVVTSAMAGVTNALEQLIEIALAGDRPLLEERLEELRQRHLRAAAPFEAANSGIAARLERRLRELRVLLRGARLLGSASPRSADAVLGHGELLAQELLAAALEAAGCPCRTVSSTDVIRTDDHFGAAEPDLEATRSLLEKTVRPLIEAGLVPVLGGYVGATESGLPTTLGRGGSDLSASVVGLGLGVDCVEIWTDVAGLMTADPRDVSGARLLERISFREAAELAGYGARVLHPASIDPALRGGVSVRIRNSLDPGRPGTLICREAAETGSVRAVARREGLTEIVLRAPGILRDPDRFGECLAIAAARGVELLQVSSGPAGLSLVVAPPRLAEDAARELGALGEVTLHRGLALVALVGDGLVGRPEAWSTWFASAEGTRARRMLQGPLGSSIALLLEEDKAADLLRRWHNLLTRAAESPGEES